jgi:hypothetical protein
MSVLEVGDSVVFHSLGNKDINGATGKVIQRCANRRDKVICYVESGRYTKREFRFNLKNIAPIQDANKFPSEHLVFKDSEMINDDTNQEIPANEDEDTVRWYTGVKIVVILRGLTKHDQYVLNGKKARLLGSKGD